jgi:hypothetical protein
VRSAGTSPFAPRRTSLKKTYLARRARGGRRVRCSMSGDGEDTFAMISGVAVFAAFCIAALLWLG